MERSVVSGAGDDATGAPGLRVSNGSFVQGGGWSISGFPVGVCLQPSSEVASGATGDAQTAGPRLRLEPNSMLFGNGVGVYADTGADVRLAGVWVQNSGHAGLVSHSRSTVVSRSVIRGTRGRSRLSLSGSGIYVSDDSVRRKELLVDRGISPGHRPGALHFGRS
ncbi:MAG: hypothetical protein AAGL49_15565, partial [Pseudomonadota bacterium]